MHPPIFVRNSINFFINIWSILLYVFLFCDINKLYYYIELKLGELKMEDNYSKAYKEVIEILNFVPKESVDKIPQTMIDTFKAKVDQNYDFKVDINKSFEEQEIGKGTINVSTEEKDKANSQVRYAELELQQEGEIKTN